MDPLDSPVEALAFNYLRFDKVWMWWIAAVAAAVSFWKVKIHSLSPPPKPISEPSSRTAVDSSSLAVVQRKDSGEPSTASRTETSSFSVSAGMGGSTTKGKFAAYFRGDDEVENFNESNGGGGDAVVRKWREKWERVTEKRMGELGWYRYQDISVINGNVVWLWEGVCRRRSTAAVVGGFK